MFTVAAAPGRDFVIKNVKYSVGGGIQNGGKDSIYREHHAKNSHTCTGANINGCQ